VALLSGGRAALVDCGGTGADNPGDTAADYFQSLGLNRIDLVVLTHYHEDHAGGIPELLERLEVLNRERGATILMVTHDAFTASCCRRVVFLRDGKIFAQLERDGGDRRAFFQQIIRVVTQLGGEMEDVL